MTPSSIGYAIYRFNEIKAEFSELIEQLGLPAVVCFVRQKKTHTDVDNGWAFYEIALENGRRGDTEYLQAPVFVGRMREVRPDGKEKMVEIIIDPETIASIEFEVFESSEVES